MKRQIGTIAFGRSAENVEIFSLGPSGDIYLLWGVHLHSAPVRDRITGDLGKWIEHSAAFFWGSYNCFA
jgi:hypothetical protein